MKNHSQGNLVRYRSESRISAGYTFQCLHYLKSGTLYSCKAPKWLHESCGRTLKVIVHLCNPKIDMSLQWATKTYAKF